MDGTDVVFQSQVLVSKSRVQYSLAGDHHSGQYSAGGDTAALTHRYSKYGSSSSFSSARMG
jgi:hypothetical protein